MEKEEDEEGRVKKFHFSKSKGDFLFPFSILEEVVLESENIFFLGKKECDPKLLEEKTNGYSLVVQCSLVEERRR